MPEIAPLTPEQKVTLIEKLLANRININELMKLREHIDAKDLSSIIQQIYDLNEVYIFQIAAVGGTLEKLNAVKNAKRNARFLKKIKGGFRNEDGTRKIVLAEGDSWFNYPVILTDVIDTIAMDKDLAVYSIASGGDWLLNMLNARVYIEELSVLHPDVFLISGGGNDLVGSSRLATILDPTGKSQEFEESPWAQKLISKAENKCVPLNLVDFTEGLRYISKDFYAVLMFFHLQYYFLINGILKAGDKNHKEPKFGDIKIITQGYDFVHPSYNLGFGLDPTKWYVPFIRKFLGHGGWLKTPMQMRGITDSEVQRKIMYAMIYLFNEMMIEMGTIFSEDNKMPNRVYHIDSRGSVGEKGWSDELHPKPKHFMDTGKVFTACIKETSQPTYGQVYVVNQFKS